MPSLRELEARFIRYEKGIAEPGHGRALPDGTTQWGGFEVNVQKEVELLSEAQGIVFLCPLCFKNKGGPIGTHSIGITFEGRGVPNSIGSQGINGKPTRWNVIGGTGIDNLQLSPSILLTGGCGWHGFIGSSGVPAGHAS